MISVQKRNAYIRVDGEFHNRIHEVVLATEHDRALAALSAEINALRAGKEYCGACGEGCESCRVLQESPDLAELAQARCEQQAEPQQSREAEGLLPEWWMEQQAEPVEPASAQDGREAIHLAFEHKLREVNLRAYGEHRGDWRTLTREEMADVVIELLTTRPAQAEQQPVACRYRKADGADRAWTYSGSVTAPADGYEVQYLYAAPIAQTAPQHPDDAAVDRFAAAMKAKLAAARAKGRGGWDDPNVCSVEFLAQLLVEHLGKGNTGTFEDVANFAMMLHQRGAEPKVLADAARPAQTEQQPVAVPESWRELIRDTLRNYRMGTLDDGYGGGYPLIDAMTADGQSVSGGIEECTYLADAIWNALRATRPAQTDQQPVAYAVFAENGDVICFSIWREHPILVALERNGHSVVTLAPIAQTAPQSDCEWCAGAGHDPYGDKCQHCKTAPQPDRSQAAELLREFVRLYGTDRDGWQIEDGLIGMARAYLAAQGGRHD